MVNSINQEIAETDTCQDKNSGLTADLDRARYALRQQKAHSLGVTTQL